ncbi:unnamed protein product [marine sediment metagenome]|uniref:Uncharacterized protein n=1 Tax=marine sediment metagenome TaxID=412755 RepID=X1SVZ7_9ZZZZ
MWYPWESILMRSLHILVYVGLAAVLSIIAIAGSGCGSSRKVQKTELEPEHVSNEESFVRTSPNQDANTIVIHKGPAFPPCEECTRRYSEIIDEIIKAMAQGMGEGMMKGLLGLKR